MPPTHRPLLGRLASRRWFNEVVTTDALRLLLDDPPSRTAFLGFVGRAAATDLSEVKAFERERAATDGRLDLEGVDDQGRPRLVVEAKFGHLMSTEQMSRYLTHQDHKLAATAPGVLLLLVPAGRLKQAREIMEYLAEMAAAGLPSHSKIACTAMSWSECLEAIEAGLADQEVDLCSARADLVQLRAACEVLGDWSEPLVDVPEVERSAYLTVVLNELKERVPCRHPGPLQRDADQVTFRYFGIPGVEGYYSLGLTSRFIDENPSPIWLRFHKDTKDFLEIERLLRRSEYAELIREFRGHIWLPLTVAPDLNGTELVEELVPQVERIIAAVTPAEGPAPPASSTSSHP